MDIKRHRDTVHCSSDYLKESVDLTKIGAGNSDELFNDDHAHRSEYDVIDRMLMGDQRNRTLFDWSPEAIVILNKEGIFLDANPRLFDWLEYKSEELIGKSFEEVPFLPLQTKDTIKKALMKKDGLQNSNDLFKADLEKLAKAARTGREEVRKALDRNCC